MALELPTLRDLPIEVAELLQENCRPQRSENGGSHPRWRRDGKELFYVAPGGDLTAVSVRPMAAGLEFGSPSVLFRVVHPGSEDGYTYTYDVVPGGGRFLALTPSGGIEVSSMSVVLNWQAGLKR